MEIVRKKIGRSRLIQDYTRTFATVVKAVVDVRRGLMALDAELHADLEALLIDDGSEPEDLWGINLYPFQKRDNFIEYVALINIRPSLGNYSMEIDDETLRKRIAEIVWDLIDYET